MVCIDPGTVDMEGWSGVVGMGCGIVGIEWSGFVDKQWHMYPLASSVG